MAVNESEKARERVRKRFHHVCLIERESERESEKESPPCMSDRERGYVYLGKRECD